MTEFRIVLQVSHPFKIEIVLPNFNLLIIIFMCMQGVILRNLIEHCNSNSRSCYFNEVTCMHFHNRNLLRTFTILCTYAISPVFYLFNQRLTFTFILEFFNWCFISSASGVRTKISSFLPLCSYLIIH